MKHFVLTAIASVFLASSATAGGISFSLPNLTFPPVSETTVAKGCQSVDVTTNACIEQE